MSATSSVSYDALIIGGGPGGSNAATFLAQAGRRVLVLEKEVFPRFHVGESLLPYNQEIFRQMGVLPKLEALGLVKKLGAQFHLGNGSKSLFLVFSNGCFTRHTEAFQVERATFDHLLLNHARESGAEVREGWTVARFSSEPDAITVEARDPEGGSHSFRVSFLIDASGRGNVTGNQEGLRVVHPKLKKLALFGHFRNVGVDPGQQGGDTIIVRLEDKWFWLIPLSKEKVSVGCVMDAEEFARSRCSAEEMFARTWQSSSVLRERMKHARLLGKLHTTSDFSYRNQRVTGHRLLRVGDAAGFMDPIFSAGVYLAMYSGRAAARVITEALTAGTDGGNSITRYGEQIQHSMRWYWDLVEGYYSKPFLDLFMQPKDKYKLPAAITAVLGGELEGGWRIRWRLKLFFFLVKLQARFGLLPPLSFAPIDPPPSETPMPTGPATQAETEAVDDRRTCADIKR